MRVLRFDVFTLDLSRRVLLRSGNEVALRPQVFDVLQHLVQHRSRVVSKKELFDTVWGGAARTDDSVVQCIVEIREALGDADHRMVKTVPRRGYLFTSEVTEVQVGQPGSAPPPASPPRQARSEARPVHLGPDAAPPGPWKRGLIAAGLLLTVLVASGSLLWGRLRPPPPAVLTMASVPSIAVLPVKGLGDETDTALATLADEIAAGIWRAPRGFTPDIKPTSAVKDAQGDPKEIGRQLLVRYVVRSLARREGEQLHLTVQLIEAESARQVWVGDFDYRLGQPGAQGHTAAHIGRSLAVELLRTEVRRPLPASPGAGHYTMLGRKLMTEEGNAKANAEAIAYFEKGIAMDPGHVLALVHYARAIAVHRLNGWMPDNEVEERLAKAEHAIKEAIKRDTDAPGAHVTFGNLLRAKGEYQQAIVAFRHALKLNSNFLPARAELGRTLIDVGEPQAAISELEKAIAASPTDISVFIWHYWAGLAALHLPDNHQEALEWLRKSYGANRHYDNTFRLMAVAFAEAGQWDKARDKVREFLELRPNARLDDWKMPNSRGHPEVAARRQYIRDTLKRLGVPEGTAQAASKP